MLLPYPKNAERLPPVTLPVPACSLFSLIAGPEIRRASMNGGRGVEGPMSASQTDTVLFPGTLTDLEAVLGREEVEVSSGRKSYLQSPKEGQLTSGKSELNLTAAGPRWLKNLRATNPRLDRHAPPSLHHPHVPGRLPPARRGRIPQARKWHLRRVEAREAAREERITQLGQQAIVAEIIDEFSKLKQQISAVPGQPPGPSGTSIDAEKNLRRLNAELAELNGRG